MNASDYNLNDKYTSSSDSYIICENNGIKLWKKNNELTEDLYLLGKNEIVQDTQVYSTTIEFDNIKKKSSYHIFLKEKIEEYSIKNPQMSKKERLTLIQSEWKELKSSI